MRKIVRLLWIIAVAALLVLLLPLPQMIYAQDDMVTVPDLTGLNIPQAAAALNKAGLAFGKETSVTPAGGIAENVISGQSFAPGQSVPRGSVVDVEVPRTANVLLIYDDNDLTLVNKFDAIIEYGDLTFSTVDSTQSASFKATRWATRLRGKQCTQVWSLNRSGPKGLAECNYIQNWLTTNRRNDHFWTGANGVRTFNVVQGGLERAICQAAPSNSQDQPTTCEFYLPSGTSEEIAPYIYLAYNTDKLIFLNRTIDRWMPVTSTTFHNELSDPAPLGKEFTINAALFGRPDIVARINRLAPKQCLLFISSAASTETPPEACDVIATYTLESSQLWWSANFQTQGTDNKQRTCIAAVRNKIVVCIMPR